VQRSENIFKKIRNPQFLKPHIPSVSFYKWEKDFYRLYNCALIGVKESFCIS